MGIYYYPDGFLTGIRSKGNSWIGSATGNKLAFFGKVSGATCQANIADSAVDVTTVASSLNKLLAVIREYRLTATS